jgi:hypothetical protein
LSRRSFRHLLTQGNAVTLADENAGRIRGYVLLLFSHSTSMARLYSIAVHPDHAAADRRPPAGSRRSRRAGTRLRVDAAGSPPRQPASLALFRRHGYRQFKEVPDYYEDHMAALRFEKRLVPHLRSRSGQGAVLPADPRFHLRPGGADDGDEGAGPDLELNRTLELRLWREATTIFMTSGHGGCGPYGLALSAHRRGFDLEIHVNETGFSWSIRCAARRKRK